MANDIKTLFEKKIRITPGCWIWEGGRIGTGYGKFRDALAHRVSYSFYVGEIPEGFFILHSCDNPRCVNPDHLRPGTHSDNMRDMAERGRRRNKGGQRGSMHGMAKLNEEQVRAIYADTRKFGDIATDYNISLVHVSQIKNLKAWGHLFSAPYDTADKRSPKGVVTIGMRHGSAKLTDDQVREIYADKRSQTAIAAEYGVNQSVVSCIKRGKAWTHLFS